MDNKARLALVLPRFSRYGGVEQFVYRLSETLAEHYQVDVICGRAETEAPAGVNIISVGRPVGFRCLKLWWFVRQADKAVAAGNYDLVMGFGASRTQDVLRVGGGPQKAFWKRSEAAWPAGLPRLAKRLRRLVDPASWLTAQLDNHQYTTTPTLVCVSHAVRDWVLEAYPGIPEPEVIYNVPDLSRFRPPTFEERLTARHRFGFADNERVITTATTNFRLKATGSLIRALRLLADAEASRTVLVVAGGRAPGNLLRLARKLGLKNRVRFLGKVDDMPALYHASDLFALPSYYDACSNAVLEARASGLAVLSSSSNGSSRFLPPAWVVDDPGDAAELATRLERMSHETPGPFVLPDDIPAGLPAWVALIEREITRKRGPIEKSDAEPAQSVVASE